MNFFVNALCRINTYGISDDGLGSYGVHSKIRSSSGSALSFLACDDWIGQSQPGECAAPLHGAELNAYHYGIISHTDGWCAGPLPMDGGSVTVEFTEIQNLRGINFLGSDGPVEITFQNGEAAGMSGDVDTNTGLVVGGVIPKITINPSGILVP